MLKKVVGPDPREISSQVPINFKMVEDKFEYIEGWWIDIPDKPKAEEPKKGRGKK